MQELLEACFQAICLSSTNQSMWSGYKAMY